MSTILTPRDYGEAEHIEKRSRFIGRVWPVTTEEEALERIRETRAKHGDATHNVYAYSLRSGGGEGEAVHFASRSSPVTRFSDDGEPGGTSGLPTLRVFQSSGVVDFCCVITRYFGGILLGSGGLVRAYSKAAKLALDAAGLREIISRTALSLDCGYGLYGKVKKLLDDMGGVEESADFGETVRLRVTLRSDDADEFLSRATELTAGAVRITIDEDSTAF